MYESRLDIYKCLRHVFEYPSKRKCLVNGKQIRDRSYFDIQCCWIRICIEFGTGSENFWSWPMPSCLQWFASNIETVKCNIISIKPLNPVPCELIYLYIGIFTSFLNQSTMYTLSLDGADSGQGRMTLRPSTANLSMVFTAKKIFVPPLMHCTFPEAAFKFKSQWGSWNSWSTVQLTSWKQLNKLLLIQLYFMPTFSGSRRKLTYTMKHCCHWNSQFLSKKLLTFNYEILFVQFFSSARSPPSCNCYKNVIKTFYWIL